MIEAYRARGWVPVPIRPGEKRPAEPAWQTRTLDSPWPSGEWDIGIVLGAASRGLVDVDLDCAEAAALAPALLPRTAAFGHRPERGHLLYYCPAITKREAYESGGMIVEIRASDCQTVVPPSGGRAWVEPWVEPLELDADELRRRVGAVAALSLVARHWPKGGRHDAQLALAGCLLSEGWTEEETLEVLVAIAGDRAKREATVRRTAERVAACEEVTGWGTLAAALPPDVAKVARGWLGSKRTEVLERPRLHKLASVLTSSRSLEKKEQGALLKRVADMERITEDLRGVAQLVGAAYPEADVGSIERAFAGSTDVSLRGAIERGQREAQQRAAVAFKSGDHVELGRRAAAVLSRDGELASDEGYIWQCKDNVWAALDDADIDRVVMSFSGAPCAGGGTLAIEAKHIHAVRKTVLPALLARKRWFADAPIGVAFRDVFIGANGVEPLTPALRVRAAYPWDWDPNASCGAWEGFLWQTYGGRQDACDFLAEFAGVCLLGAATRFQRFLILYGDGGTGKSQVLTVLRGLMPEGTVASVAPHDWRKEYSRAAMAGIRLNAVAELPSSELFDAESVKAIIAGDVVQARRPYKEAFELVPVAGHLFAANILPPVRDSSRGFWRRAVALEHLIVPGFEVQNIGALLLEHERPGIVRWAIDGGWRAIKRGGFVVPKGSAEVVEEWRIESDSVALWLRERTTRGGEVSTTEAYSAYRWWATEEGHKPCSGVVFGKRLARAGVGRVHTKTGRGYGLTLVTA